MKTKHVLLLILCVLVLTGCPRNIVRNSSNVVNKPVFKLHVAGSSGQLKIKEATGNGRCNPNNPTSGCVRVPKLDTALINFELKNSSASTWHFTQFIICPGSAKDVACNLESWQQSEFFAADSVAFQLLFPDTNGKIDLTQLSANLTEFYIFDFNSVPHDFFYSIEVCNTDDVPECLWTDPPIENEGRR